MVTAREAIMHNDREAVCFGRTCGGGDVVLRSAPAKLINDSAHLTALKARR